MSRTTELRVKIKSLASEGRHIRREENRRRWVTCPRCEGDGLGGAPDHVAGCMYRVNTVATTGGLVWSAPNYEVRCDHCQRCKGSGRIRRRPAEFATLHAHRTGVVRSEARCSLIAYAFLRGKPLWRIQKPYARDFLGHYHTPGFMDLRRARKIVEGFGDGTPEQLAAFDAWAEVDREPVPAVA